MESKNKLLIVDDCPITRLWVKDTLADCSVTVVESATSADVMRLIVTEKPGMILLDIHIPGKDGIEVLEDLLEEHFHIPVIIISSDTNDDTRKICLDLGVKSYLVKPFGADVLRETVLKYLQ